MSLNLITTQELKELGFSSDTYKGFSVWVTPFQGAFLYTIALTLEPDSDACHIIENRRPASCLAELKTEAMRKIEAYPYNANQLKDIHRTRNINNLDSGIVFEGQNGCIVEVVK